MARVSGDKKDFSLIKDNCSSIAVCYGLNSNKVDGISTWNEIVFYKKQTPNITINDVRNAVFDDINRQVKENILNGFIWKGINVHLSKERQQMFVNLKNTFDSKDLPIRVKLGNDILGNPSYYVFNNYDELCAFCKSMTEYIYKCLQRGWCQKDSIDWCDYIEEMRKMNIQQK